MAAKKTIHKRAVEALLSDDLSALTVGDGMLFDVAFDGIRQHEQRRNAARGKSKRLVWADALAEYLATAHPDSPTERLLTEDVLEDAFQDETDEDNIRRHAGYEVWLGEDEKARGVLKLMASKHGAKPSETRPLTLLAFKKGYLGPAHRRVKDKRSERRKS